mgnify:CR=1 FL=1
MRLDLETSAGAASCRERIRTAGGTITREAGPVKGGSTVIAFVQDPDGYKIELIERKQGRARSSGEAAASNR